VQDKRDFLLKVGIANETSFLIFEKSSQLGFLSNWVGVDLCSTKRFFYCVESLRSTFSNNSLEHCATEIPPSILPSVFFN